MAHGDTPRFGQNPLDILDWDEFDYLVPPENLGPDPFLPNTAQTIAGLRELGNTMTADPAAPDGNNSPIPAPYTYLGQFVDHDITLTTGTGPMDPDVEIGKPDFQTLTRDAARAAVRNQRTSSFDLDSLYGLQPLPNESELAVPFKGDKFELGSVDPKSGKRPPKKEDKNDLPRVDAHAPHNPKRACIGDPRNDENVIVAQLHLAFLKFHNAVVDDGFSFEDARRLVTHHYQWVVLHDFLPRVCDPAVVRDVLQKGNRLYRVRGNEKFMPFEFAVAAYRFGHSLVRRSYDFNLNFLKKNGALAEGRLDLIFQFTGLSGQLGGFETLPENWIIEWERMLQDRTMQIDPTLTTFLAQLPGQPKPLNVMQHLAIRNLLKGHLFNLPTGQALAQAVLPPGQVLTPSELEKACRPKATNEKESQSAVLKRLGFDTKTPLWFYLLAEAKVKTDGSRLGPLGSLLVCETIIGLLRANPTSILNVPFSPTLGPKSGSFDLQDLMIKAGVLSTRV